MKNFKEFLNEIYKNVYYHEKGRQGLPKDKKGKHIHSQEGRRIPEENIHRRNVRDIESVMSTLKRNPQEGNA